jgi:hypothetical protein
VLQHALKYLLLAKPEERFRQVAGLLGLTELDNLLSDFVALCTKPDAHLPPEARALRACPEGRSRRNAIAERGIGV